MAKNWLKNKAKTISYGTMLTAGAVSAVFALNAGSIHSIVESTSVKDVYRESVIPIWKNPQDPTKDGVWQARPAEKAPKNLFKITPIDPTPAYDQSSQITNNVLPLLDGLSNLGVAGDLLRGFQNSYIDLMINQFPQMQIMFQSRIDAAKDFLTSPNNMQKQFMAINQFGSSNKELLIYAPDNVFDTTGAGATGVGSNLDPLNDPSIKLAASNVHYKVASIALDTIKDNDKVLNFDIEMPSGDKYSLLFNNKDNGIVKELDKTNFPAASEDVNTLLDNSQIILRSDVEATPAAIKTIQNQILLNFNKSTRQLEVIVNTHGVTDAAPIKFKAASTDTQNLADIGFLDADISPLHLPTAEFGGNLPFTSPASVANKMVVHALKVAQKVKGSGKTFTMWMADGANIKLKVNYPSVPNAWVNSNEFSLKFDGTDVSSVPGNLSLNKGTTPPSQNLIHYDSQTTTINGVKYAKVEVYTDGNALTINADGAIRVPGIGEEKILFELPGNDETLTPTYGTTVAHEVKITTSTNVTDKWREYINNVYGSWFGLNGPSGTSQGPEWVLPDPVAGDAKRKYDFNYEFFFENPSGGIIKSSPPSKDGYLGAAGVADKETLLIKHDPATFSPMETAAGDPEVQEAFGKQVVETLSQYYNTITEWNANKFGITNPLKGTDYYALSDPSDLDSIVKVINLNAPKAYADLVSRADALVVLAWEGYGSLTSQQKRYIDSLDTVGDPLYNHLGIANIKDTIDFKIGNSPTTDRSTGTISSWTPDMITANHNMMYILEGEIIKAVQEIFENENLAFEATYSSLLGKSLSLYITGNGQDYKAISPTALQVIDDTKLDPRFAGEQLVALNGNPIHMVREGQKQLKSLLDFISNFKLQDRYLDRSNAAKFDQLYASGEIFDSSKYDSATDKAKIGDMIKILDEIIKKALGASGGDNLQTVIRQIELGIIQAPEASTKIKVIIDNAIDKITNPSSSAYTYSILSEKYTSSYIENQVMGKNLSTILKVWLKTHSTSLTPSQIADLKQKGLYDPQTLANMAVSAQFYNFDYFIKSLTTVAMAPATAAELLDSNLEDEIVFKIPESNSIVNALSNPKTLIKYGLAAIGALIAVTGIASLGISRTKSSRGNENSRKSSIAIKGLFMSIAMIGMAIVGIGLVAI